MEWTEDIKVYVDDYVEKKARISVALSSVLSELLVSPYNYRSSTECVSMDPLIWEVQMNIQSVGRLTFHISIDEIKVSTADEIGNIMPGQLPDDLESVLRQIITSKIKQALSI